MHKKTKYGGKSTKQKIMGEKSTKQKSVQICIKNDGKIDMETKKKKNPIKLQESFQTVWCSMEMPLDDLYIKPVL